MPHISPEDINRIADFESYRRDHGSYPESKSEATLIDHLNPRYLPRIIRGNPYHQPYEYKGSPNTFIIRSTGRVSTASGPGSPSGQPAWSVDATGL